MARRPCRECADAFGELETERDFYKAFTMEATRKHVEAETKSLRDALERANRMILTLRADLSDVHGVLDDAREELAEAREELRLTLEAASDE